MEMTTGLRFRNSFMARHMSSDAVTSPPGESMRTMTALMPESLPTLASILSNCSDSMPESFSESGSPRVMEPWPTTCFAANIHGPLDAFCEGIQLPEFGPCLVPATPGLAIDGQVTREI